MNDARPYIARIERLEIENEKLRQQLSESKAALNSKKVMFPFSWKLQKQEEAMLSALVQFESCSIPVLRRVSNSSSTTTRFVAVRIHQIRKKIKDIGVEIENVWGRGYRLSQENKHRLAQAIEDVSNEIQSSTLGGDPVSLVVGSPSEKGVSAGGRAEKAPATIHAGQVGL